MNKVTIPVFDIFEPKIPGNETKGGYIKSLHDEFTVDNYQHFPMVMNDDGTQWIHANRYILYRIKINHEINHRTLSSIADDLVHFKEFCALEDVDYMSAPRKIQRPTWLYREYLLNQVREGSASVNTAKRRLSSLVGFYEWLIEVEGVRFKFPLWQENMTSIFYKDRHGLLGKKDVASKDVAKIRSTKNQDLYSDEIMDGGRLHPLTQDEQVRIITALKNIENTEMTLAFLIALTTGARMQSVFTLRLRHFQRVPSENEVDIRIPVGLGTGCDTKYDKRYTLLMPRWVYDKIRIYNNSPRAAARREKAKHIFDNMEMQYVFLGNRGTPYYAAQDDKYRSLYRNPPSGMTVRQFISNTLNKEILKTGNSIAFTFHDLRASYGMNLFDKYMPLVEARKVELSKILIEIKDRMGHSGISTTEQYLNYRGRHQLAEAAQDAFELHMKGVLDG